MFIYSYPYPFCIIPLFFVLKDIPLDFIILVGLAITSKVITITNYTGQSSLRSNSKKNLMDRMDMNTRLFHINNKLIINSSYKV